MGVNTTQITRVSITIGKPFKGGVVGAVAPVQTDYGSLPIVSKTGAGSTSGDIKAVDTLAAYGQTMLAAVGADHSGHHQQHRQPPSRAER